MEEELTEKRDYGKEFEEEVRTFLKETLKLSDVNGGPDFHIAPKGQKNQIDACGRFGDVLFVFECKAAGRKVKKSYRQDILAGRERARMIWDGYKDRPEYSMCTIVKYIFITKKIEIPDSEKDLFKDGTKPHIWYADEKLLEYYVDLAEKVGEYAIYNFLADYGIPPPETEELKLSVIKTKIGKYSIYNFFAKPKELLKFAYVARRRSLKEDFYQRMLDKSRIRKIQKFLDDGGIFPTNIVISLRGLEEGREKVFEKAKSINTGTDSEVGVLTIKNSYSACWIIDGQHRLYSYAKSKSNELVSCIAFDEIGIEEERRFFLEINREQRPIQPDLIWDLEGLANPDTPRGIISNIVRTLNNREPFLEKIYIPVKGSKSGKIINMAAFCNGLVNSSLTKRVTPNCNGVENILFSDSAKIMTGRVASVLEKYFLLLNEHCKDEYKSFILGNAGVPIMLYLLEPIIAQINHIPSILDLKRYVLATAGFFENNYPDQQSFKKLKEEANSEGARKNIAKQIGLYIRKEIGDKNFWPRMEQIESVTEIVDMERRIANLIADRLSQVTTGWEIQNIPQSIYRIAKERMEKDGTRFDENLDLSDELQIITRTDNWKDVFAKLFINKDGFLSQEELRIAFGYLSKIRNPASHGKSVIFNREDLKQCEIYLQKFSRIAPEVIPEYPDSSE